MTKMPPATRARKALSVQRAWEIAIAVADQIRGRAHLKRDTGNQRIGSSGHEWLDITLPDLKTFPRPRLQHALEWVARAREACVVWHMLACCRGFSGHENERFWKRLVDEASRRPPDDHRPLWEREYHANDESSLSPPSPTVTGLPRFRLVFQAADVTTEAESDDDEDIVSYDWWVGAVRTFAGMHGTTARSASTVQGYVSSLPHVDETKFFEQAVEICFHMTVLSALHHDLADSILALSTDVEARGRETTTAQRKSDLLAGTIRFPVVTFKEFPLALVRSIERDDMVAELLQIFATAGNFVTLSRLCSNPNVVK